MQFAFGDEAAEHLLAFALGIAVGAVDEVAAVFHIAIEDALGFGVVGAPAIVAEGHGAQRQRADAQPGAAQGDVFVQLHDEVVLLFYG